MNDIEKIIAEEIFDSRGNPAIKVSVFAGGKSGSFSVPSGASTGIHEALELRDGDRNYHGGKGVFRAIDAVNSIIAPPLVGKNVSDQAAIDALLIGLDGTKNKSKLGANALIGVSVAIAKCAAAVSGREVFEYLRTLKDIKPSRPMPYLYMNLINGGKHASSKLAFQEYHVVPMVSFADEAVQIGEKIQNTLKEIIEREFGSGSLALGDEGGFALQTGDIRTPLLFLNEAMEKNNLNGKVRLALDVAASSFYKEGKYAIGGKEISKEELMGIYDSLIKEFNLLSIEDPFEEEDFGSFGKLKDANVNFLVVGDDLTTTNKSRLQEAIEKGSINAMIIKPNQIGTLSEMLETMKLAREHDIELIISHRSGETEDDFIADVAYAFGCFGLKAGAPQKEERRVKYERLKAIEKIN